MALSGVDQTLADWRALVQKELGDAPFEKLVGTSEGLAVQPLYTEAPPTSYGSRPNFSSAPVGVCMRHDDYNEAALAEDLDGGSDALWLDAGNVTHEEIASVASRMRIICENGNPEPLLDALLAAPATRFVLGADPVAAVVRGRALGVELPTLLEGAARCASRLAQERAGCHALIVSTLPYHDAGADDADELAFALATGVLYLGAGQGIDASQIALQVAVGRGTFAELCKLRALRLCWQKICVGAGAGDTTPLVHAVCSSRTITARDPWVNLLRVSTQLFAAILGGADLVTPSLFDAALGITDTDTARQSRRIARNTALVLREESHLGRVVDPAGGAYFFESFTDALARQAWDRFQQIERDGGMAALLVEHRLRDRIATAWQERAQAVAKRKEPIVGTSEFANLDEARPAATPITRAAHSDTGLLPRHRDAESFEALRDCAELTHAKIRIVALGPPAEHRARVGFATALFATGGIRVADESPLACICGSDERYAAEAVTTARTLKAQGATHVLLAGRPGTASGITESELRAAGVDGLIYLGCDVVAALKPLLAGGA